MLAQNEVNKVVVEFSIVRILLDTTENLLLAFTVKHSSMVIFITLAVSQYFSPPNYDAVQIELKILALEGMWSLILFGLTFMHQNTALKLQTIFLSARESVKMLAFLLFCTEYVDITVPCDKQGSSYHKNALHCYLQAIRSDSIDYLIWNQLGLLSSSMSIFSIFCWSCEQDSFSRELRKL